MKRIAIIIALLALVFVGLFIADSDREHNVPTLKNYGKTTVTTEDRTVTVTFGPINLPSSSMPSHIFEFPEDMYLVGYKAAVFTKDGATLPQNYLHHVMLLNKDKKSLQCPRQPFLVAGVGVEMTDARFPDGYGVKLGKGEKLTALVSFHHMVPPTDDVMASFTLEMAPEGATVQPMELALVGVNVTCVMDFGKRGEDETKDGILIKPGVNVQSAPLKFQMNGCTKAAYPHGHDQLLLITLDNKTTGQTLLRTVPNVTRDGTLISFPQNQVYQDPVGFSVNTKDDYEMTMVHHKLINDPREQYGMGYYLMYMTPGPCLPDELASVNQKTHPTGH